ncbi:hypothetical protein MHSWG343_05320 [Candidatus Mycoplasma haematohominis]|uniref:Uncharacterized protein n=1 Tax=Candidatus Mycoplasma haematohominis TaxID=1494318 RepID=A0A478FTW8_9MOLU|nr:hypothetical protein MHSWG343_05320 [Candidatus Mycoplasma haemohominis]
MKKERFVEGFYAKLIVQGDACKIPAVEKGFMPFWLFCKNEVRWGARAMHMQSPPNIPALKDVHMVCIINGWLWETREDIKKAFQVGKTVNLVAEHGRFIKREKDPNVFFLFFLVSIINDEQKS